MFEFSADNVWGATQRALSEDETIKVLDRGSGVMVTEFRTIDARELSLAQTYFLGKTYKSSYTVNLLPQGASRTEVRVNVKLQAVQLALLAREEGNEVVEGYLRKRLFERITTQLASTPVGVAAPPPVEASAPAPVPAQRQAETPSPTPEPVAAVSARSVPTGPPTKETIARAQVRLKELGFDPGGSDGSLGPRTVAAIRKFQTSRKLPVSGQLTPETLSTLGIASTK